MYNHQPAEGSQYLIEVIKSSLYIFLNGLFGIICLNIFNLLILNVPGEGYSRNA